MVQLLAVLLGSREPLVRRSPVLSWNTYREEKKKNGNWVHYARAPSWTSQVQLHTDQARATIQSASWKCLQ